MEEEKKVEENKSEKEIKVKESRNIEEDKVVEKTELDSMGKGVKEMEAKMDDLTTKTKEVDEIISDLDKEDKKEESKEVQGGEVKSKEEE